MLGLGTSKRVHDAVNLCAEHHEAEGFDIKRVVVDVSQDMLRRPWSADSFPTLTRSSEIFVYARERALIGTEHLQVCGFQASALDLSCVSQSQQKDLAGDGMAVPSVTLVVLAAIAVLQDE